MLSNHISNLKHSQIASFHETTFKGYLRSYFSLCNTERIRCKLFDGPGAAKTEASLLRVRNLAPDAHPLPFVFVFFC